MCNRFALVRVTHSIKAENMIKLWKIEERTNLRSNPFVGKTAWWCHFLCFLLLLIGSVGFGTRLLLCFGTELFFRNYDYLKYLYDLKTVLTITRDIDKQLHTKKRIFKMYFNCCIRHSIRSSRRWDKRKKARAGVWYFQ